MRYIASVLGIFLLMAGVAAAQPVITGGPVNAASYALAGLPNANIAQGSMFILFGRNLGPPSLSVVSAFPLPATLSGTSIRVTVGSTTVSAIMIYTLFEQVAAILPSSTPTGDGTLTLSFNNVASAAVPIRVVRNSIGVFARNSGGSGQGVAQIFNSQTDLPLNTMVQAAAPGKVMILWGTGLGPVSGNEAAGPLPAAAPSGTTVDVFVGGKAANVVGFGRSGCCAGVDQIAFTVPDGVQGCYVPVAVRAGGVVSNFTTISVASSGSTCSDPAGFSAADLQNFTQRVQGGGTPTIADISMARAHLKLAIPGMGTAGFGCLVGAEAGSFTVPAWVMSALPASGVEPSVGVAVGGLSLAATLPQPSRFQATGIDVGFFNWGALQTKNVNYQ